MEAADKIIGLLAPFPSRIQEAALQLATTNYLSSIYCPVHLEGGVELYCKRLRDITLEEEPGAN